MIAPARRSAEVVSDAENGLRWAIRAMQVAIEEDPRATLDEQMDTFTAAKLRCVGLLAGIEPR